MLGFFKLYYLEFGLNMMSATFKTLKSSQNGALKSRAINNKAILKGKAFAVVFLCFHLQKSDQKYRCDGDQQQYL